MYAPQTPVAQFVDVLLGRAVRDGASDLHIEPSEAGFRVRYRIEGELFDAPQPPRELAAAVVSRIKVLASLDIAERRLPQDGRIRWTEDGRAVDLRVSTLPTASSESIVIRVLDPARARRDLSALGLPAEIERGVRAVLAGGEGLLVVTGPTGSGKTTTLYALLRALDRTELKVLTIEDPVEYEIDGVLQVAVNPAARTTFATALRHFLRQDPDVIMVGEIRDAETAQIAIQAALTGHLVLATLHTEDAAGVVTRLVDLGVERYLVAAVLRGALAQRLVRRPDGAAGQIGLFDWLPIDGRVRRLIARNAAGSALLSHDI